MTDIFPLPTSNPRGMGVKGPRVAGSSVQIQSNAYDVEAWLRSIELILAGYRLVGWLMDEMDPYLRVKAARGFQGEYDPMGQAWEPLTESTERIRERQGYPPEPINDRSGEMKDFILRGNQPLVGAIGDYGALMEWPGPAGNSELKAKLATAAGGKRKPRTPARPIYGLDETDALAAIEMLTFWFTRQVLEVQMVNTARLTI